MLVTGTNLKPVYTACVRNIRCTASIVVIVRTTTKMQFYISEILSLSEQHFTDPSMKWICRRSCLSTVEDD